MAKAQAELTAHEKAIAASEAKLNKQQQDRIAKAADALKKYEAKLSEKLAAWEKKADKGTTWTPLDPAEVSSTSATTMSPDWADG